MLKLTQRRQYQKSFFARRYWDVRDVAILKFVAGQKIIDLGCGEGITLAKIVKKLPASQVIGIDNDPEKISICRRHRLPAKHGDITRLPFAARTFDCALLIEVIEHLTPTQIRQTLNEIRRILKPAGRLIMLFPNDRNFKISRLLTWKFTEALYDYGHLHQWQPDEAKKILAQAGFKTLASQGLPLNFWPLSLHHLLVMLKK